MIEGTVIHLQVDHLPGDGHPKPVCLWFSGIGITVTIMDRPWQMVLRRFDLEHTFRFLKQLLGWTRPRLRSLQASDRWTTLIISLHPSPVGTLARRRCPTPLGTTRPQPSETHPGPCPSRISRHPAKHGTARQRSEIITSRTRSPTGLTKQAPRCIRPRRKNHQNGYIPRRKLAANGLNNKLSGSRSSVTNPEGTALRVARPQPNDRLGPDRSP